MDVKELTAKLIQQEFGEWLIDMKFSGPFEGEALDVDIMLKEMPADLGERDDRIDRYLRDKNFDVLIGYDVSDDSEPTEPLINLSEQLKAKGFISNIPDEVPSAHENQPAKITGKPVSEIILENRGPK